MAASLTKKSILNIGRGNIGVPIFIILILAMMILPLPPFVLDLLFTFSLAFSLIVLLSGIYVKRPLDFALFPTVVLLVTLLRLALNIASTRVILLNGSDGTAAAGKVIQSFGDVVVGGNYAVGLVVFAILVIINFVVVTKGAGRVSEVSARFTLDSMPGKQMAIDADLNAGVIDQEEAKQRRQDVTGEADFYGAMDGASKFVRGDAVAGILILLINIIGGLAIGVMQHGMPFSEAMHNFTLLTIGDGLVTQVPALLLSTSAAIIVTRVSSEQDIESQFSLQLFNDPRTLAVTACVIGGLGIIPGMPHLPFITLALMLGGAAHMLKQRLDREGTPDKSGAMASGGGGGESGGASGSAEAESKKELSWGDVRPVDVIGLEVGYRLISLVDENQGGELMPRIKGIRKKLSQELGFLIPSVHIRDNLELNAHSYRISIMGVSLGEADVMPDKVMAISSGQSFGELKGEPTRDPAFGLDALWIAPDQKEQAQALGYTVVDCATVVATHLSQVIQSNASQLLGHGETQEILDRVADKVPKLIEGLVPDMLPVAVIVKIMQGLLEEKIPLKDPISIVETLAANAGISQDPDVLLSRVRERLSRLIVQTIYGASSEIPVITLAPKLEQILQQSLQATGQEGLALEPSLADTLQKSLVETAQNQELRGEPSVLLVSAPIRSFLSRFARFSVPNLHVLAYQEVPDNKQIRIVGTVGNEEG